jgi:hypothetical protein
LSSPLAEKTMLLSKQTFRTFNKNKSQQPWEEQESEYKEDIDVKFSHILHKHNIANNK